MTNPRNYPDTLRSAESGREMRRGFKRVSIHIEGHEFHYDQPGWWCSLDDPNDLDGQLMDEDNKVADISRKAARDLVDQIQATNAEITVTPSCGNVFSDLRLENADELLAEAHRALHAHRMNKNAAEKPFAEHSCVIFKNDIENEGTIFPKGTRGTIVGVYERELFYDVELYLSGYHVISVEHADLAPFSDE